VPLSAICFQHCRHERKALLAVTRPCAINRHAASDNPERQHNLAEASEDASNNRETPVECTAHQLRALLFEVRAGGR
jgi:hypothetical protein